MTTATSTLSAVGAGTQILVRHKESVNYYLSGTFAATLQLVKSDDGGQSWETLLSKTAGAKGSIEIVNKSGGTALVMWRCTAYTSGRANTLLRSMPGSDESGDLSTLSSDLKKVGVVKTGGSVSSVGRSTLIIAGESIAAVQTEYTSGGAVNATTSRSWVNWGLSLAGVKAKIINYPAAAAISESPYAKGGLTTSEFIANGYLNAIMAQAPDVCVMCIGVNNTTSWAGSVAAEVEIYMSDMEFIFSALKSVGTYVIWESITPTSGGDLAAAYITAVNNRLEKRFLGEPDGEYANVYSVLVDAATTNSPIKTAYTYDNTHQSSQGAYAVGSAVFKPIFQRLFPPAILVQSNNDTVSTDPTNNNPASNQFIPNPMMLTSVPGLGAGAASTNASGTIADRYILIGATGVPVVGSLDVANSGIGQKQILTVDATTQAGRVLFSFYSGSNTHLPLVAKAGQILQAAFKLKVTNASKLQGMYAYLFPDAGAGSVIPNAYWSKTVQGSTAEDLPATIDLCTCYTQEMVLTADITYVDLYIWAEFATGATAGTVIEIEQVEVRNLSI